MAAGKVAKDRSWLKFWSTPLGVFVVVVVLMLSVGVYFDLHDRRETKERRQAFCEAERTQNFKQRQLWEFVVELSSQDPDNQTADDEERRRSFLMFVKDTFPVGECVLDPDAPPVPKPSEEPD